MKFVLVLTQYDSPSWIGYIHRTGESISTYETLELATKNAAWGTMGSQQRYEPKPLTRELCRHISAQRKAGLRYPFYLGFTGRN